MNRPVVWAVGGIDPSGGAGLFQDLRVMAWSGVHPMGIPSALTAQNIDRVDAVSPVDPVFFGKMVETLLAKHPPRGVKVGLLPVELSGLVVRMLKDLPSDIFVAIDPIFRFGSGDPFLEESSCRELAHRLFPLASLVLPNLVEAEVLIGSPVPPLREGLLEAALMIKKRYSPRAVYLKGGHRSGPIRTDVFVGEGVSFFLDYPEVSLPALHGGGCTLGSLFVSAIVNQPLSGKKDVLSRAREEFQRALVSEALRPGAERRTLETFFSSETTA